MKQRKCPNENYDGCCDYGSCKDCSIGIMIERYEKEIKGLKAELDLAKAFHDEKCAEFDMLCYDYNKLLYIIRCNMTSITRYVNNKNETYDEKYKELAVKAVENILKAINCKVEE